MAKKKKEKKPRDKSVFREYFELIAETAVFVFFVMAVAAAEAAVGLAIIIAVYRHKQTVNLDKINLLSG